MRDSRSCVGQQQKRDRLGKLEPVALRTGVHLLSVDLEPWCGRPCIEETEFLLDLFARTGTRATFFVLGTLAEQQPDLVRRIDAAGHEIASHGWNHDPLFAKRPNEFREDLTRAVDTLSGIVGKRIVGFRAPEFSIDDDIGWAFDVLAEAGCAYDSSIFPIRGFRYGVPWFPRGATRIHRAGASIIEVPLSTVRYFGANVPVAGGGYFRLMPYAMIRRMVESIGRDGLSFVTYFHPYEFSREWNRIPPEEGLGKLASTWYEWKFNLFRSTIRGKLARLLAEFRFGSFAEVLRGELVAETQRGVASRSCGRDAVHASSP